MTTPRFIFRRPGERAPVRMSSYSFMRNAMGLPALIALTTTIPAQAQTTSATYLVTFQGNWAVAPNGGLAQGVAVRIGAHFTELVGAVHNDMVTFWEPGGTATSGVEGVAELGATTIFGAEVAAAAANASLVRKRFAGAPTGTATFEIEVTSDRPLFTLLSMIGPSPDWFVGVSGLSLLDDQDEWLSELEVDLFPYDAGTEDGEDFNLPNPSTNPQGTIQSLKGTGKFSDKPMARLSFDLEEDEESNAAPAFTGSTSFSVQENSVTVGTVQATDSDDADNVTGYAISAGADGALFSIASGGALTFRTAPNYEDPQDDDGNNRYEAIVEATSGTGDRALSAEQTIMVTVTDENTEAPDAPDAPDVSGASASSLTASWSKPGNDGPPITDYDYRYRIGMPLESWTEVTTTSITGPSTTISDLAENTRYDVQVRAKNAEGSSDWSSSGTGATQIAAPGQVTGVSVTEQVERLAVSWNVMSRANGYKVQWKSGAQDYNATGRQHEVAGGGTTSYAITGLSAGVEYTVRVIATRNNTADGPPSAEITGTPLPQPPQSTIADAPENLQALAGTAEVVLSWDAPGDDGGADIASYQYRQKESGENFSAWTDIPESGPGEANARSYTVTGLTNGQEYVFRVRAVNEHGGGAAAEATVTLPSGVRTESEELPTAVALLGNYPNPFNTETTIRYALPQADNIYLAVYDLLGQEVAMLVDEPQPAGRHVTRFDAGDLPSGAYAYRLQTQGRIMVRIMLLVK